MITRIGGDGQSAGGGPSGEGPVAEGPVAEGPVAEGPVAEGPVAGPYPEPLTPLAFLDRAAAVFGDRLAVVDGDRRFTYAELADRSARLAGALAGLGFTPGDRVAVLSPNSHVLVEAHFGVNLAGAVLVALNTRLGPRELAAILGHCGARVV